MRLKVVLLFVGLFVFDSHAQVLNDNFEGQSSIDFWYSDNSLMNISYPNPFPTGMNSSTHVLRYQDLGGQYANIGFNSISRMQITSNTPFSFKIYVPSSGLTGNQTNQVSLKLQNANLGEPWTTQSEIIKPIVLNQWQTVTFNFMSDPVLNYDNSVPNPSQRVDLNRVVIQVNGENNNNHVLAYIDDFNFSGTNVEPIVYDYLVWSDEFDTDGALNAQKWFHQTILPNGNSWYNDEVQHYTNRIQNSFVEDGFMHIVARKENFTNQGVTKAFTSARLNSKFAFKNGRVEVRAKMPSGVGTWPAIWTLGKNINENGAYWFTQGFGSVSWPACGEIDIMEHWGNNQNYVQSALHTPSSFGATVNHGGRIIPTVSDSFHIYVLDWYPNKIVFSVDGIEHYTYQPSVQNAATWPFNLEQYLILNIAIQPSISSNFTSSSMIVDYLKVYQRNTLEIPNEEVTTNWRIYPNPSKDELTIELDESMFDSTVEFIDIQGRVVDQVMIQFGNLTKDISNWQSGVYFARIAGSNTAKVLKLIKE
jgi:beta-glucanase (GH16 family)